MGAAAARRRLSIAALGTALAVLVSVAWGTGLLYLAARLGLPAPVRLAVVDGVHAYTGLVGGVVLAAKVVRVRHRRPPPGSEWERWISRSMLILYGAVIVTGTLALLPLHGRWPSSLVQAHLMTSVWALAPTSWHVWHHRQRALPWLGRPRLWAGIAVAAIPALIVGVLPRAASQLSDVSGGAAWVRAGLPGVELGQLTLAADGRTLLAGGDGLYVSEDAAGWRRIALPEPPADAAPGFAPAAGHQHASAHGHPGNFVQAVLATAAGVYVGTTRGLYHGRTPATLQRLDFPGRALDNLPLSFGYPGTDVRALAAGQGRALWAASSAGPMRSADGGASWTRLADGLASPSATTAVAFAGSRLFASDETGVYEWTGRAWQRRWAQKLVVRLDAAGQDLFASSSDGSLGVFTAGRWRPLAGARAAHGHGHQGEQSVLLASGRLYASAAAGVVASADAGRTWITLGGGLPAGAGQLTGYHGWLWAATASGVYCYPLAPAARPATPLWWLFLATAALLAGLASIAITAKRGAPAGRRARPRHARY